MNSAVFHSTVLNVGSQTAMLQCSNRGMRLLSRVVWSEGMYLGPHHFQVQSRYFEDSLGFAISTLWYASYGLAGIEMDGNALQKAQVALRSPRGLFQDG